MKTKILEYILDNNGNVIQQRIIPRLLSKKFPELYEKIKDDYNAKLFMFINDLKERPNCKICGKITPLKNYKEGFRKYCSNRCVNQANSQSIDFGRKISESRKTKFDLITKIGEDLIIKDYYCNSYGCKRSTSMLEEKVYEIVKQFYSGEIKRNYRIEGHEFDIFLPELNVAFEVNGLYWHSDLHKHTTYHQEKKLFALKNSIQLMYLWEDDILHNFNLIKSMVRNKINSFDERIMARNCKIQELSGKEERSFLSKNHLQGWCVSSIRLGLFYEEKLVSVMTFIKNRMILGRKNIEGYELLRFCNEQNTRIVGGAGKLLKYFINKYEPTKIISYANLDISDGDLYKKLGFVKEKMTPPGYWWWNGGLKQHRSNFMKFKLQVLEDEKEMTAPQIMKKRGYLRIYNSGNIRFSLIL